MPGNSQRKGAIKRKGKSNAAGSGGRVRRGLEGKGPTPKAEDRPYHKAYKAKQERQRQDDGRPRRTGGPRAAGPEWIIGRNPVLEALQAELPIHAGYVAEGSERDDRLRDIFKITADRGISLLQTSRGDLDRMTSGAVHQGVALQLPSYDYKHPDDLLDLAGAKPLFVALDKVTDPRNLGAIVRSAAAFGANGVLIPERRSAGMTAAAWKTSAGAAARIPIARATNLTRTLQSYAKAGLFIVGLDGDGDTDIAELPQATDPLVLVVGSEGEGLSRLVRESCDVIASIPIRSSVESLNAGVATSVALYEVARHRN
ncbi:23S rRNA (guanosine(2251)-2'-O)-methyltransferase RlmB [Microlunatus soli]|uniref:23S rRNA (guanosine(2251)-2'-O)-methyltransferase RlmB n=1 Tax=Microlunatus soli TaxID=630515 RepID=UPI000B80A22E|nr:23S rRNA (guanosine(2251)-2'-O)-methyltransferase RlmB [Microlunatus soli]